MLPKINEPHRAIHAWVSGRVQGINFRKATCDFATERGITGWTRNLEDGRVEVVAHGTSAAIADLTLWLHHGPPLANVTHVLVEDIPWEKVKDFSVIK